MRPHGPAAAAASRSDLEQLCFLVLECLVDLRLVGVGESVQLLLRPRDVVFGGLAVLGEGIVDRAIVGRARAPFFKNGTPPASTLVGVSALALPEWLVEIEAIAVVD